MATVTISLNETTEVPSVYPKLPFSGLAVVGEAPGRDEVLTGEPFTGPSGMLLNECLSKARILRASCFVGNVCRVRPSNNDISKLDWHGAAIQSGLQKLRGELAELHPKVILALGNTALKGLLGMDKVSARRGSIYWSEEFACKVIPSIHPASILREWSHLPLLVHDINRVSEELETPYSPTIRNLELTPSYIDCVKALRRFAEEKKPVSFDIEGYVDAWEMCSLSNDRHHSIVIDWLRKDLELGEKMHLWMMLRELLENPEVPKILQNSLYDRFVLSKSYGILIRSVVHDTMLKHWEVYPEFPKGLGFLCSIYTKQPYYKDGRDSEDIRRKLEYAALDACITLECNEVLEEDMNEQDKAHYRFNMALLNPMLYMELRGIRYDVAAAKQALDRGLLEADLYSLQVNIAAGRELNVESPKQCADFCYNQRGYTPYYNGYGEKRHITCDAKALLKLAEAHPDDKALKKILRLRRRNTINGTLGAGADADGRIRCGYNVVGTETGRITCYESPTGSGFNLQTVPKELRYLFLADDGHFLFQCDLSGADAWTVAAHCYAQGDYTMLEDLRAGIKVAKVIALLFRGSDIDGISRRELAELCKTISSDDPIYFGSKCCQHGSNYNMKPPTMSDTIFKQSHGEISIPSSTCALLQRMYFRRYPGIRLWHSAVARELLTVGAIKDASGHSRTFFGRRGADDTLRAGLSHEPQANTTYVTNTAMLKLWRDPENRRPDGSLRVEPLHQVHDALLGQFATQELDFAAQLIRRCFDNPITVAGITLTIPFEGGYGPSWGDAKQPFGMN